MLLYPSRNKARSSEDEDYRGQVTRIEGTRIIHLTKMVDEDMAHQFFANILKLESEDTLKDIVLYIDTYGGYVDSLMAMYDAMQACRCDIQTVGIGKIMSAGCLLLAGGTHKKRYLAPHSSIMMHQVSGATEGTFQDMNIYLDSVKQIQDRMVSLLSKHIGVSEKRINTDFDRDFYLTAREALRYGKKGFADHIMTQLPRS